MNEPIAFDDGSALAIVRAVAKLHLRGLLDLNADRVMHFVQRMVERGVTPAEVVIVVIHVDDALGARVANALMPGHNWQEYRDRGEMPVARGLAGRAGIQSVLDVADPEAAAKLRAMATAAVIVIDEEVAEVYDATTVRP